MLTLDIAGAQIDGARDYQEDAFLITRLTEPGARDGTASLCIVADGMGGHAAGNVASNIAVQTFNKHITTHFKSQILGSVLREAVLQANNSISETVHETVALKGMGCTLIAVIFNGDQMHWVSVGDSHLYLLRDGILTKKNADHSYGGFLDRMTAEGTPIEPEAGFSRNMLMSALTGEDIADIDCPEHGFELKAGDRVILASDGLDSVSSGSVIECCGAADTAKSCVDALIEGVRAADMPRQDNTTVIVIQVTDKRAETAAVAAANAGAPSAKTSATSSERIPAFVVEHVPERHEARGKVGLIIATVIAHLVVIGGGIWWLLQPPKEVHEALDEPAIVADTSAVAEPDTTNDSEAEQAATPLIPSDAQESDTGDASIAVTPSEPFRDPLKGGGEGPSMIRMPGGSFMMGSPDSSANFEQRPQHLVNVRPFAMSVFEISVADYARFASATGRRSPPVSAGIERSAFPATFISWNDALVYSQWLTQQTGKTYRLPSEAEWEYAARSRSTGNYWWGHELGTSNAHCIACDTGLDPRNPTKAGRFNPNAFGLYDTAGNVQEWVYDCYHENYAEAPIDGGVFEGGDCNYRVVRGGAFGGGTNSLRSAHRDKFRPDQGNDSTGIRLVRDL